MSNKKLLFYFFMIVVLASGICEAAIIITGNDYLYMPLMWIPAVAAMAVGLIRNYRKDSNFSMRDYLQGLGFHRCNIKYILLGCLLPLVYLLIPYIIYWSVYPEHFAYKGVSLLIILKDLVPVTIVGIVISLLSALGEEIGWRGFMVPALYDELGLNKTLVISSLFWCCWHLPLLIFGDYIPGAPIWYQVPAFILCIFPVGIMAGLLAIKTNSVWPSAFLHAAHNNYDQAVFDVITIGGDNKIYFVSETGLITIICTWVLAIIMYIIIRRDIGENSGQIMAKNVG